jgi:hypothetical protein
MARSIETARELHLGIYIRAAYMSEGKASWMLNNMRKSERVTRPIFLGERSWTIAS